MTSKELTALKAYMYIDTDTDDGLISSLYAAAIEYMANAGVTAEVAGAISPALYRNCAFGLTLQYYDKRTIETSGASNALTLGVRNQLNQLKGIELAARSSGEGVSK